VGYGDGEGYDGSCGDRTWRMQVANRTACRRDDCGVFLRPFIVVDPPGWGFGSPADRLGSGPFRNVVWLDVTKWGPPGTSIGMSESDRNSAQMLFC
jgi:hypothetical protein